MGNTNSKNGEGSSSSSTLVNQSVAGGSRGDRAHILRHVSVGSSSIAGGGGSGATSGRREGSPSTSTANSASTTTASASSTSAPTTPSQGKNPWDATPLYPQEAKVDNGHLLPLTNIYPNSPQDWLHDKVQTLIVERKLAPFYRGLEDWDEPESSDDFDKDEIDRQLDSVGSDQSKKWRKDTKVYSKEDRLAEAAMYRRAQECPICFLYYPPLINTSRCCDQPICTECFVQIKRADPTTTNLISEPAACPYCVEPNFGVTYVPPPPAQRTGLGASNKSPSSSRPTPKMTRSSSSQSSSAVKSDDNGSAITVGEEEGEMGPAAAAHARRKSLSHTAAEVVTVDSIQQDWEVKLASIRATAARRAARRVIFRQIGDRLIPVGISSGQRELNPNNHIIDEQGRIILTGPVPIVGQSTSIGSTGESGGTSSRLLGRSGRRHRGSSAAGGSDEARLMNMGPDIEELMVMEAMRLSMLDEEERRKKAEKEAKKNKKKKSGTPDPNAASTSSGPRLSFDAIRNSIDSVRHRGDSHSGSASGTVTPTASNTSPTTSTPTSAARSASTSVSTGTSTSSSSNKPQVQFLKMPPMQRNDSSASMIAHNLPPPLVPTKAGESSRNVAHAGHGTTTSGLDNAGLSASSSRAPGAGAANDGSLL